MKTFKKVNENSSYKLFKIEKVNQRIKINLLRKKYQKLEQKKLKPKK